MPKNTFCLIKTCALISNSLFYNDELVTFSPVVNAQCQSNIVSIKRILRSYPWKNYKNFNWNGLFTCPKNILLDWNLRSDLEKLVLQRWTCDIIAGSQRSMSVKHSFNQTNIALISVEKLNIFQLKWVIHMPKNTFCLIKTCALISNSSFCSDELVTFSPAVNAQCQSNIVSIKQILRSYPWKNYKNFNWNGLFIWPKIHFAWLKLALWSRKTCIAALNLWHFRR